MAVFLKVFLEIDWCGGGVKGFCEKGRLNYEKSSCDVSVVYVYISVSGGGGGA